MALAAANELPQRTCTAAALDRQICRSLLVTPPKEISLRPTPSFGKVKRRKLLKVYYQQPTKPPVTLPNAPIDSEVQEDDHWESPHPTEIDVLIEVDVQVEERKVNPSRAIKRVLGTHVDETASPLEKSLTARVGSRSKRLATIGAEADKDRKKLNVKKNDVKQQWANLLNWNNPRNKEVKNYEDESSSFDSSSSSQVNKVYEEARKLYEECRAEEEEKDEKENNEEDDMSTTYWTAGSRDEEASGQQCGKTAEEETNTEFRHARLMNDYYEDYYEDKQYGNEIWRSYSNQCDNSTISSVNESRNDEDEEYEGITKTGPSQFEVYIDVEEWTKTTVTTPDWNDWTMDSAYTNDKLDSVNADKCNDIQVYCGYQIAANKQYRLTKELFDRLKERGITIKMK